MKASHRFAVAFFALGALGAVVVGFAYLHEGSFEIAATMAVCAAGFAGMSLFAYKRG